MNPHLHAVPGIDENGEVDESMPTTLEGCWRMIRELRDTEETLTGKFKGACSQITRLRNQIVEHRKEEEGKEMVREVLGYWRDRVAPRAEIAEGDDRWEKVRDRLGISNGKYTTRIDDRGGAGFTVEELKLTVDGALLSPFHCGENDKGKTYLDAASIFGTTKRVRDHSARALEAQERLFEERLQAWNECHPTLVYEAIVAERQAEQLFASTRPLRNRGPVKPRLLDLFCGAGGAAVGYHRAGFEVVGVDHVAQRNYPFEFVEMDALEFMGEMWGANRLWEHYDAIHASPPCQFASDLRHRTGKDYPDLVTPIRELLQATGLPYVIENVSADVLEGPGMLCGSSFGLGANGRQLRRHRFFECNFPMMVLLCQHRGEPVGVYGTGGGGQMTRGYKGTPDEYREAMGIDWATRAEIAQAIPPAFTEHVGGYLLVEVQQRLAMDGWAA